MMHINTSRTPCHMYSLVPCDHQGKYCTIFKCRIYGGAAIIERPKSAFVHSATPSEQKRMPRSHAASFIFPIFFIVYSFFFANKNTVAKMQAKPIMSTHTNGVFSQNSENSVAETGSMLASILACIAPTSRTPHKYIV